MPSICFSFTLNEHLCSKTFFSHSPEQIGGSTPGSFLFFSPAHLLFLKMKKLIFEKFRYKKTINKQLQ